MKLLTKAIEKNLPALYANEKKHPRDIKVPLKMFSPWGSWTWYATEYDPETKTFFGWVDSEFPELGYFNLDELESVSGPYGLKIERDMHWNPNNTLEYVMNLSR